MILLYICHETRVLSEKISVIMLHDRSTHPTLLGHTEFVMEDCDTQCVLKDGDKECFFTDCDTQCVLKDCDMECFFIDCDTQCV